MRATWGADRLHRWRLAAVLIAILASAAVIAACGGGDDNSNASGAAGATSTATSGSTPAAKKPTGTPIKTMTIASVNYNGPTYPNILETAKLYAKYINDRGGIAGHPLEVTVCDEQGDPNQLLTCGRRAAAEGAVAVVGSFTLTGERIVPLLEKENISWFGVCCPLVPAETNNPITFSFGPGAAVIGAYAPVAVKAGCKKIALVVIDTTAKTYFKDIVETSLKGSGQKLATFVTIPPTSQDYAPQVAQATSNGVDCIVGIFSENQWATFLPAFKQTGSTAKLIGPQGNLDEKIAKDFPDVVKDDIVVANYPNITDPAFKDYREAIEQYKPPTEGIDYNSLGGLGTWTAYVGFKQVVESIDGPINHDTFLEAANKMTNLDTGGKIPVLDLSKPWGPDAPLEADRLFTRSVTYLTFDDKAKLQPYQGGGFQDMTDYLYGKGDYSDVQ
jgi:ABC-type branched-subunit amino acid transport system substrate-binding protein